MYTLQRGTSLHIKKARWSTNKPSDMPTIRLKFEDIICQSINYYMIYTKIHTLYLLNLGSFILLMTELVFKRRSIESKVVTTIGLS